MSNESELVNAVIEAAIEIDGRKKLACAEAFRLAEQLDVKVLEIARICNTSNIKICKCQLGCFR